MDFVTPALLAGAGLATIPVVLHLVMRQQPRHLEFPALRFVQMRQDTNRRKLKLRHLLLLALRMAAIALLAAALARPSIKTTGVIGNQEAPVAAALVFDTSPRMDYKSENRTRLEAGREIAGWLLKQLPEDSRVAVLDSKRALPVFQVDQGAAQERLARMETTPVGRPLWEVLESAAELLEQGEIGGEPLPKRKEIYVFTDLSQAAWDVEASKALRQRLAKLDSLGIYVVDVGIKEPVNFGLGEARLPNEFLARNRPWMIGTEVFSTEREVKSKVVEVYLYNEQGEAEKRGHQPVEVRPGETHSVEFSLGGLETGAHQGYLRLIGSDGLACDDRRFFTVEVKPPWKVLVAAAPPAEGRAVFLVEALAPSAWRKTGQARFDCQVVTYDKLPETSLEDVSVVALLDPGRVSNAVWEQMSAFARSGGGVAIFLGAAADPEALNQPTPQLLLPGPLGSLPARYPGGDLFLTTDRSQHPMVARFLPLEGTVPWDALPVYMYWQLPKLAQGVSQVAAYRNGKPALLERPLGRGRAATMTTPVSEGPETSEDNRWNRLATGLDAWPFVMLMDQMFSYLAGSSEGRLNYLAGETAVLPLTQNQPYSTYLLSTPRGDSFRQTIDDKQQAIIVPATDRIGNYRIKAGGEADGLNRGFSVNLPVTASDLQRFDEARLPDVFGQSQFRLAHNQEEIDRDVSAGRVGQELFPLLMLLIVAILGCEQVLANRFYRET
jgi:hypothetical protein